MKNHKAILPEGWNVKRVTDDKVVVQQVMEHEIATFVADTRPGVPNEIFYRLASDLADKPVADPVRDILAAALKLIIETAGNVPGREVCAKIATEALAAAEAA